MNSSTPGVRVTWSTTAPPECVASVKVVFRHSPVGAKVTTYTATNMSGTQVIQSSLQCGTEYYVRVFVVGVKGLGGIQRWSMQKRVYVGGKKQNKTTKTKTVCMRFQSTDLRPLQIKVFGLTLFCTMQTGS